MAHRSQKRSKKKSTYFGLVTQFVNQFTVDEDRPSPFYDNLLRKKSHKKCPFAFAARILISIKLIAMTNPLIVIALDWFRRIHTISNMDGSFDAQLVRRFEIEFEPFHNEVFKIVISLLITVMGI